MVVSRLYSTIDLVSTTLAKTKADLVVKNVTLVNVYTDEPLDDVGIAIKNGRVTYVGPSINDYIGLYTDVIDGHNLYAVPGFLDGHIHIESSMLTPSQFARAVLP